MRLTFKKKMRMLVMKIGKVEIGLILQSWRIYLMVIVGRPGIGEPKVIGFEWFEDSRPRLFRM